MSETNVRQLPQSSTISQQDGISTHSLVEGHKVWLLKHGLTSKHTLAKQSQNVQLDGLVKHIDVAEHQPSFGKYVRQFPHKSFWSQQVGTSTQELVSGQRV